MLYYQETPDEVLSTEPIEVPKRAADYCLSKWIVTAVFLNQPSKLEFGQGITYDCLSSS